MSYPNTRAPPRDGRSSVASTSMAVVLPAPFGPSSPTIAPAGTSKSSASSARVSPKSLPSPTASIAGGPADSLEDISSSLGFELEIAIAVIDRTGRFVDGFIDDRPVRRERADGIGVRRAAGQGKSRAGAPAKVDGLPWTAATWLRHPFIATEGPERRRLFPDPGHCATTNTAEFQPRDACGAG